MNMPTHIMAKPVQVESDTGFEAWRGSGDHADPDMFHAGFATSLLTASSDLADSFPRMQEPQTRSRLEWNGDVVSFFERENDFDDVEGFGADGFRAANFRLNCSSGTPTCLK